MQRHDIEFNEGNVVTFNAYGEDITAMVKKVDPIRINMNNEPEERIFYKLAGYGPKQSLVTTCTGQCIRQSKYFKPFTPEDKKNFFK
jgi:hypothetical protein